MFKIRCNVNTEIFLNLYYSLIYPVLTYGLLLWGNTYDSNLNPIIVLQKRVVRTITFAKFNNNNNIHLNIALNYMYIQSAVQ